MDRWRLLAELASTQFGLVAVWQADQLGIPRQLLAERPASHGWARVGHGVYQLPGHSFHRLAQIKCIQLLLRNEGVPAGESALFVWEIARYFPRPIPFLVRPDCSKRPRGGRYRASNLLPDRELKTRNGILVPDPAWAICTAAADAEVLALKRFIMTGHRLRLLTPTSMRAATDELGPFKHRARVYRALDEIEQGGLTHSELERIGRGHLLRAGFVPHPYPLPVEKDGRLIAELDIAFPEEKVGIPIHGPHHLEEDQRRFDEDQRFELESIGWRIITADEQRLRRQAAVFVRQVREALEAARRDLSLRI